MFNLIAGKGMKMPQVGGGKPRLAEYEQIQQRCRCSGLHDFTPSAEYAELDAMGMIKMFFSHPLQGIIKRK